MLIALTGESCCSFQACKLYVFLLALLCSPSSNKYKYLVARNKFLSWYFLCMDLPQLFVDVDEARFCSEAEGESRTFKANPELDQLK